jgi:hypothetical protein
MGGEESVEVGSKASSAFETDLKRCRLDSTRPTSGWPDRYPGKGLILQRLQLPAVSVGGATSKKRQDLWLARWPQRRDSSWSELCAAAAAGLSPPTRACQSELFGRFHVASPHSNPANLPQSYREKAPRHADFKPTSLSPL